MVQNVEKSMRSYMDGSCGLEKLNQAIMHHSYFWAKGSHLVGEEQAADFCLSFQKKGPYILKNYKVEKGDFATYLRSCYRNHARMHFSKAQIRQGRDEVFHYHFSESENGITTDNGIVYGIEDDFKNWVVQCKVKLSSLTEKRRECTKRRVLCLFLYHAALIPSQRIRDIAELCGVREEVFKKWIRILIEEIQNRIQILNKKRIYLNQAYVGLKTYQWMLHKNNSGKYANEYRYKVAYYQKRVDGCLKKIHNMRVFSKQESIAKLLDLPTGTVSSSIHYARRYLKPLFRALLSQ